MAPGFLLLIRHFCWQYIVGRQKDHEPVVPRLSSVHQRSHILSRCGPCFVAGVLFPVVASAVLAAHGGANASCRSPVRNTECSSLSRKKRWAFRGSACYLIRPCTWSICTGHPGIVRVHGRECGSARSRGFRSGDGSWGRIRPCQSKRAIGLWRPTTRSTRRGFAERVSAGVMRVFTTVL